jgi:hypothetical protein
MWWSAPKKSTPRARVALERAQEQLGGEDPAAALAAMERAQARIRAAERK